MKTKDFFRMEYAQILIYIVFLGLLEVLLFIFEVNYFLMIYLLLIGLILEGVYLCQRYMKKYRYYKKVKAKLDILEQKCMITEMLELPDFAEGEFLYEILQTCNKSMNDEILIPDELACDLIGAIKELYPKALQERYAADPVGKPVEILEAVAGSRKCYSKGEQLDLVKASGLLIDDFRSGKLGRMTLERIDSDNE